MTIRTLIESQFVAKYAHFLIVENVNLFNDPYLFKRYCPLYGHLQLIIGCIRPANPTSSVFGFISMFVYLFSLILYSLRDIVNKQSLELASFLREKG